MTLLELVEAYLSSRAVSPAYAASLRRTAKRCVGAGLVDVGDLTSLNVNAMLASLVSQRLTDTSRANVRRETCTLWKFAIEIGETDVPCANVVKIRASNAPATCWSMQELKTIVEAAEKDNSEIGGKFSRPVSAYMPGWVTIMYDTGMRFADVHALAAKEIRFGSVCKVAAKTRKPLTRPLSEYSVSWCSRLIEQSPDGTLFSWFLTRRRAFTTMRSFLDRHGFGGSGKWLRRSCATAIESERPGMATRYLQHSDQRLLCYYVDESLLAQPEGPPPINRQSNRESR